MQGIAHESADIADLGDAAGIHHGDAIGGLGDHAHVVGDQHHRGAVPARQVLQDRDDLRLHRNVERGRRLVGDDQRGLGAERERDHDALAHAAGEFMRIAVDALFGRGNADFAEPCDRPLARLSARQRHMRQDRLDELVADPQQRIEAGQRILEDDADAAPAYLAHPRRRQIVDARAVEPDFAAGDAARRIEQADDGEAGERFAGAGFADHAENLAGRDVERDAVERDQRPLSRGEFDAQIADREQRRSFQPWVERVAQPVAEQIHRQHQNRQRQARKRHDPPFARKEEVLADPDQRAERRLGRRQADAEERQRRLGDDGEREVDRRDHQHRPHHVGQDMADEDARGRKPINRAACT